VTLADISGYPAVNTSEIYQFSPVIDKFFVSIEGAPAWHYPCRG
jgi:hypothetical protein